MADGERDFIRWLTAHQQDAPAAIRLGIGDDMAELAPDGPVLVTCDMLLDGVHFDTQTHSPVEIGRKAAACSLSDCAAMAVRPLAAVVSVALPHSWSAEQARELASAIMTTCGEFGATVVGGDTTAWDNPLAVDVTMLGVPYPGIVPVRRDGAQPGDGVYVTGPLGGSLLGGHLTFTPRVHEAKAIAETLGARLHAMLDISDGLAIDLDRIVEASGVAATLDEAAVLRIAGEAAHRAAGADHTDGKTVLDHVLGDGEDFELLLAADIAESKAAELHLTRVGEISTGSGLSMRGADGSVTRLAPQGFQHLT